MSERLVDARGLKCPWPVLRLARAMGEADAVTILADDPNAAGEIAALANARGWTAHRDGERFTIRRRGGNFFPPLTLEPG